MTRSKGANQAKTENFRHQKPKKREKSPRKDSLSARLSKIDHCTLQSRPLGTSLYKKFLTINGHVVRNRDPAKAIFRKLNRLQRTDAGSQECHTHTKKFVLSYSIQSNNKLEKNFFGHGIPTPLKKNLVSLPFDKKNFYEIII